MAFFGPFSRFSLSFALSMTLFSAFAQRDEVGSGHALRFDGVNDQIELGNVFDDVTLPITISAWIKISPDVSNWAPILVSQDNAPIYNGFWFIVRPDFIAVGYGDGNGEFIPEFRRGKEASIPNIADQWTHVATVVRGAGNMSLYVNGIDVGGNHSGSSFDPMSSNWPSDVARIGKWTSNGQTVRFKGDMDEVRFWRRDLSVDEIRASMCKKIPGTGTALAGLWSFNELSGTTCIDDSPNHYNGTFNDNPLRVFSGAAIGEVSIYNYNTTTLSTGQMNLAIDDDAIHVTKAIDLLGVHVYAVDNLPSQVGGINFTCTSKPYFGVFVAPRVNYQPSYDATCTSGATGFYVRDDNSVPAWVMAVTSPGAGEVVYEHVHRSAELLDAHAQLELDLGADSTICAGATVEFKSDLDTPGLEYLWNTGAATSSIVVSVPGIYWLQVDSQCGNTRDSVVLWVENPPAIDLGPSLICIDGSAEYDGEFTYTGALGATIEWGREHPPQYTQKFGQPGKYWVTAIGDCGTSADTAWVVRSPQGLGFPKSQICSDVPVTLSPNLPEETVVVEWFDGTFAETYVAEKTGFYSVKVYNQCGMDSTSVDVRIDPRGYVLPNVITPDGDGKNETFKVTSSVNNVQLVVYDRWGLEVYRDSDYQNDWSGAELSTGVYYYKVTLGCQDWSAKGHVSIVR